jgi:DNA helicase II / ATP-dependent DNA helicase PcrA
MSKVRVVLDYSVLNKPQRAAVEHHDGPLVIFAGAGSGKTLAITYRIAHLVQACGVPARRILAVTFTNKAAKEMRERLDRLLPYGAPDLWVGTFHATCAKLLRRFSEACGVRKGFVIYDELDQRALIARIARDLDADEKVYPPKRLAWMINRAKQEGISCEEFVAKKGEPMIARVYTEYEQRLAQAGALDFDDLIYRLVAALRTNPTLRHDLQQCWDHVLVDEFQDTNAVQFQLVRDICQGHRNLCVVGDDDQSIYRWRGADYRNILDFQRHFSDAKLIKLEQNYRSTKRIISVANALVGRNIERQKKRLWTDNEEGQSVTLYCCADGRDEALRFVNLVLEALAQGSKRSEVALLYRTHAQSRVFEEALRAANLPYRVVGGIRFYDRAEVKDLLAYLRVLQNPDDDVSLLRIINTPTRGIGKTTIDRLLEAAARAGQSVWNTLGQAESDPAHGAAAQKKLAGFLELIAGLQQKAAALAKPAALIESVLEQTEYVELLRAENTAEADAKLENIRELVGSVREFERTTEPPTLESFLETVTLQTDQDRMQEQDAVALMTVHAAKGLEFPTVMVAGLEEGLFPHIRNSGGLEERDDKAIEEERRLAYVAFTRAKRQLFLSHARQRYLYGDELSCVPSRFLDEIPSDELKIVKSAYLSAPRSNGYHGEGGEEDFAYRRVSSTGGRDRLAHGYGSGRAQPRQRPSASPGGTPTGIGDSYVDRSESSEGSGGMRPGAHVSHPKFGVGQVKEILAGDPPRVLVKFSGGPVKTVITSFLKPA